jgi:hypothetical protein
MGSDRSSIPNPAIENFAEGFNHKPTPQKAYNAAGRLCQTYARGALVPLLSNAANLVWAGGGKKVLSLEATIGVAQLCTPVG